jgi:hypothetical protein
MHKRFHRSHLSCCKAPHRLFRANKKRLRIAAGSMMAVCTRSLSSATRLTSFCKPQSRGFASPPFDGFAFVDMYVAIVVESIHVIGFFLSVF